MKPDQRRAPLVTTRLSASGTLSRRTTGWTVVFFAVLAIVSAPVSMAKIYKYKKDGVWHFTDTPSELTKNAEETENGKQIQVQPLVGYGIQVGKNPVQLVEKVKLIPLLF